MVNAGIAGNQIAAPLDYSSAKPVPGGPAAITRLTRDVLSLSGVSAVIWLEVEAARDPIAWNRMAKEKGRLASLCSYPWIMSCVSS